MKTITRDTYLLIHPTCNIDWKEYRVEYTPLKRDPLPEDRVLWVTEPQKNILEILSKMDDKDYEINEDEDTYTVIINLSMFPKLEELKVLDAVIRDDVIDSENTAWDIMLLRDKEKRDPLMLYELPPVFVGNTQSVRKEETNE